MKAGDHSPGASTAEGVASAAIGERIGNYLIVALLGQGGMGAVYLARNPEIDREVAIKVLPAELSHEHNAGRFVAEARAIAALHHPNIVDIYDFGRSEQGWLYYVMEALQGCDLGTLLEREGPLSPRRARPLVEQVCSALQVVHDHGIVHRDIKPSNVFVLDGPVPRVKLLDFGLVKRVARSAGADTRLTASGVLLGTPVAMAPEQASGRIDEIGPATDIYALGVLMYWTLAGKPPFDTRNAMALLADHLTRTPPSLSEIASEIPAALVKLVERCLCKRPEQRPRSARAVAQAYAAAVGQLPEPADTAVALRRVTPAITACSSTDPPLHDPLSPGHLDTLALQDEPLARDAAAPSVVVEGASAGAASPARGVMLTALGLAALLVALASLLLL